MSIALKKAYWVSIFSLRIHLLVSISVTPLETQSGTRMIAVSGVNLLASTLTRSQLPGSLTPSRSRDLDVHAAYLGSEMPYYKYEYANSFRKFDFKRTPAMIENRSNSSEFSDPHYARNPALPCPPTTRMHPYVPGRVDRVSRSCMVRKLI
jgi:hypothetical protein